MEIVPRTFEFDVAEPRFSGVRKLDGWFGISADCQRWFFPANTPDAKRLRGSKTGAFAPLREIILAPRARTIIDARPHPSRLARRREIRRLILAVVPTAR